MLSSIERAAFSVGLDANPQLLVDDSFVAGLRGLEIEEAPSLLLAVAELDKTVSLGAQLAGTLTVPVAAVIASDRKAFRDVVLLDADPDPADGAVDGAGRITAQVALRIGGRRLTRLTISQLAGLPRAEHGRLFVMSSDLWPGYSERVPLDAGAALVVFEAPPRSTGSSASSSGSRRSDRWPAVAPASVRSPVARTAEPINIRAASLLQRTESRYRSGAPATTWLACSNSPSSIDSTQSSRRPGTGVVHQCLPHRLRQRQALKRRIHGRIGHRVEDREEPEREQLSGCPVT